MKRTFFWIKLGLLVGCIVSAAGPAQAAGWLDSLFGKSQAQPAASNAKQHAWYIREFTNIELVPREPGSQPNQHPMQIQAEALRQQLLLIKKSDGRNNPIPLFDEDEAGEIAGPLIQAFNNAGPDEDVQLLSSARRNGVFGTPRAITARLFVQGDALNLIVHDTDLDFVVAYRQSGMPPHFVYGSRNTTTDKLALQGNGLSNRRGDWLVMPLREAEAKAPPPSLAPVVTTPPALVSTAPAPAPVVVAPMPVPAAAPLPAAVAVKPSSTAPAAAAAPARKPAENASADDIERRLETLKRLRDRQLISEEEYQQRRKEVLQSI